jgi:hypothetical protein
MEVKMQTLKRAIAGFGSFLLVLLFFFQATALASGGQAAGTAPLTNDDVIRMVQAKLPDAVVVAKIKSSPCKFDTSADTLIKLKSAGVSDAVLQAMAESAAPTPTPPTNSVAPALGSPAPATAPVPGLPSQYGAYYKDPAKGWVALEQAPAARTKSKGMGLGIATGGLKSPQIVQVYKGAEAPVRIHEPSPTFYVRGLTGSGRGIVIVRMDKKKDRRELQVSSGNILNSGVGYKSSDLRDVSVAHISDDVLSVVPKTPLDAGEYALDFGAGPYDFGINPAE